jgi:tetratricopeptide (TPR) repeat protein
MNTSMSAEQIAQGHALQRAGRFSEAEVVFRRVLADEPRNAQALHLLGVTVGRMGRHQDAVNYITSATRAQPSNPVFHTNLGHALIEVGRNADAVKSFDRALHLKPDLTQAYRGRGIAQVRLDQAEAALSSFRMVVQLTPGDAQAQNDLGVILERMRQPLEALEHFGRAITLNPYHPEAHNNRGQLEMSLRRYAEALVSFETASQLQPRNPTLIASQGNALRALRRPAEALELYDRALALNSGHPDIHHNRALALVALDRWDEALEGLDRALALAPNAFGLHFHRGVVVGQMERYEESAASFERALAIDPTSAESLNNRGVALEQLQRPTEALEAFDRAIAVRPNYLEAITNAGNTLKGVGRFPEALDRFDRALAIAPDHPPSQWGKSLLKLTLGEFDAGWPLYESRLHLEHLRQYQRDLTVPRWSGAEPIDGKTILIHAEQGIGDTLQFVRYIPLLEQRGARVVLEVPPVLEELLRSSFKMTGTLILHGDARPAVDYHCPLLSLPLAFHTGADSIPDGVPYVAADAGAVSAWRERLSALPGFKIGLNWQGHAGSEKQPWVRGRSFALAAAAPLAAVPGVTLVSLQKAAAAEQRQDVEFGQAVQQLTDPLDTSPGAFMETAALMGALDLVITSDTSTAHLAGALGVPAWVVLHKVPDWRWLLERGDSPWYPSLRLVRQQTQGDWRELFERVAHEVQDLVRSRVG